MLNEMVLEKPAIRRRNRRKWLIAGFGVVLMSIFTCVAKTEPATTYEQSPQFREGRFHNVVPRSERSFSEGVRIWWDFLLNKPAGTTPDRAIPVQALTRASLLAAPDNSVWRLGHSSLLLKLHDKFWLVDPVFSDRSSPVQWYGPQRFHAPPITLEELPPIEAVIISHNHYDHFDYSTILSLQDKVKHFVAPLGVGRELMAWGVPAEKVQELDWWDRTTIDGIRVVATPAQHFSGRSLADADRTLWASWVVTGRDFNLFFSGDSGYFPGFKEIGRVYGPFDMAFVESGAYDKRWEYVHMLPEQTLQAFQDLGGKRLFPIHNGTFDLAMHAWDEPMEQITRLAAEQGIPLSMPMMGELTSLLSPHAGSTWWRD